MLNFKAKMFYSSTVSRNDYTFTSIAEDVLRYGFNKVSRIPLLDSHDYDSVTYALGYVDDFQIETDDRYEEPYVVGKVHINPDNISEDYKASVENMTLKCMGLSVGIRDIQLDKARLKDGYRQIVSFLPYELSLTYLPADTRCVASPYEAVDNNKEIGIDNLELN